MAFIEPMHRNKPNITYLLTYLNIFLAFFSRLVWHVCTVYFHRTCSLLSPALDSILSVPDNGDFEVLSCKLSVTTWYSSTKQLCSVSTVLCKYATLSYSCTSCTCGAGVLSESSFAEASKEPPACPSLRVAAWWPCVALPVLCLAVTLTVSSTNRRTSVTWALFGATILCLPILAHSLRTVHPANIS